MKGLEPWQNSRTPRLLHEQATLPRNSQAAVVQSFKILGLLSERMVVREACSGRFFVLLESGAAILDQQAVVDRDLEGTCLPCELPGLQASGAVSPSQRETLIVGHARRSGWFDSTEDLGGSFYARSVPNFTSISCHRACAEIGV